MSTTSHLTDKLDDANTIKAAIYSAILAKGGTFASGTDLSDYPAAILSISGGGGDDFSWIRRAQDEQIADLSGYKLPSWMANNRFGMYNMFSGCNSITTPPDLSDVTWVGEYGMFGMFDSCHRLRYIDLSSITSVGSGGMEVMLFDCESLSEIKVGWSAWPGGTSTLRDWVYGVSATGTFHCPPGLPEIFDSNHIPPGWTVVHDVV